MKFSIRDLLWLTVVVALAVAWWAQERQLSSRLREVLLKRAEEKQVYEAEIRDLKNERRKHFWGEGPLPASSASTPNPPKP